MIEIVKELFGDYIGYAAEVGAFNGIFQSPTLELEKLGWTVLLIEPIPSIFKVLVSNRNSKYCLQCAVGISNKDNVPFEVYDAGGGASFSSLIGDDSLFKAFGVEKASVPVEIIFVNVRTLDFCLNEVNFSKIDIVSIDVEGGELNVLQGFNINKWKPKLLIIENILDSHITRDYLPDYTLTDRVGYNDIMVRIGTKNV